MRSERSIAIHLWAGAAPLAAPAGAGEPPSLAQLRAIKPPVHVYLGPPWWAFALAALAILALAALVFWWWRRRRARVTPEVTVPPEPADVVALAALGRLAGEPRHDHDALQRFFFRLSEIVRAYVEARFALNATDLTTEEIAARLRDADALAHDERARLLELLRAADAVKFAKRVPAPDEPERALAEARRFVEATPPAPASEVGAA